MSLTHLLLVPHRMCLLHGLEHADGVQTRTGRGTTQRRASVTRASAPDLHDRCALGTLVDHHQLQKPEPIRLATPAYRVAVQHAGVGAASREVWLLAPKQGPPV